MKVRFQADADLNEEIVRIIRNREPLIDFQTAEEAGLRGLEDETVLALASSEKRILISHDRKTMPYHFANFIQQEECWGVFIVPQDADFSKTADDIILIWSASEPEEWLNIISELPFPSSVK